jgi:hypothetical protein
MNERIRELADQAGIFKLGMSDELVLAETEYRVMETFAELIVKECMSLVSEPGPDMNDTERGILAQIKQHFGVEE